MAQRDDFIFGLMPYAQEASRRTGVDPRIIIAQAAQETGWGKSAPGNNYFGIKSHGKSGGQNVTTHEVINGKRVKINDSFRQYKNPGESALGYADFINSNPRYGAFKGAQGLDAQIAALGQSGYATDPNYANSVGSIARSINLPQGGGSQGGGQQVAQANYGTPVTDPALLQQLNGGVNPINNRPILDNGDGSFSTEESVTLTNPRLNGGKPTNVPSIWGGKRFENEDEIANNALRSGQSFEAFDTIDAAVLAAKARSNGLAVGVPQLNQSQPNYGQPVTDPALLAQLNGSTPGILPDPELQTPQVAQTVPGGQGEATAGHKVGAAIDGVAQGLTFGFSDEIAAGLSTGFGFAGDYDKALADERARMEENKRLAGGYELGGQVVGALGGGLGLAKAGLSASTRAAKSGLPKRIAAGLIDGAAYGGAYGVGTGENTEERVSGGLSGAATGAALGGAIPAVGAGLRAGGRAIADRVAPTVRGIINPQSEAARRVGGALQRDGGVLSQADEAAALVNQQPLLNVDRGGETTRALARSAANQSPEARDILASTSMNRFGAQGDRAQKLIDRVMNGAVDDIGFQEAARTAARKANAPAYEKAFQKNYGDKFPAEFQEMLTRIPAAAVANATKVAKAEGRPFGQQLIASIDEAGDLVEFTRMPSIREWHYIQRGLRSAADSAYRGGVGEVGTAYKSLHKELLTAIDSVNPDYKAARQGAAAFFGADDALEAGRKFVTQNKDVRQAAAEIAKMKPAEREAFQVGFAGELRDSISKIRDRSSVTDRIFGTEQSRRKLKIALGPKVYDEFETFVRVENAMDAVKNAITGNSTTARQLAEMGLAQGAQMGAGGGIGYLTGDWQGALAGAALARGVRTLGIRADQKAIEYVGRILTSNDPAKLKRGIKIISRSSKKKEALDGLMKLIESASIIPATQTAIGQ